MLDFDGILPSEVGCIQPIGLAFEGGLDAIYQSGGVGAHRKRWIGNVKLPR